MNNKIISILISLVASIVTLYFLFIYEVDNEEMPVMNEENVVFNSEEEIYGLKVEKNEFIKALSCNNDDRLSEILKQLSTRDLYKIQDIANSNNSDNINQIMYILNRRLSSSSFEEAKVLLTPYIYFSEQDNFQEE